MNLVDSVVLPGDVLDFGNVKSLKRKVVLGPGIRRQSEEITVTKPGILRLQGQNTFWVDSHLKRYVPVKGDYVIGVVTAKAGDIFRIDIGGSELASLSYLEFEGATKRNRPDVKVGDLVYAQLTMASKDMEPELVCMDVNGKSAGMGVIRGGGLMFQCSLNLVRKILNRDCVLMTALGHNIAFEAATGMNGRVWINSKSTKVTIDVCNAILASELMSNEQIKVMCKKL